MPPGRQIWHFEVSTKRNIAVYGPYLSVIDSPQTLKAGEETGNPDHVNYSTVDR